MYIYLKKGIVNYILVFLILFKNKDLYPKAITYKKMRTTSV